jgi:hypothetical protein
MKKQFWYCPRFARPLEANPIISRYSANTFFSFKNLKLPPRGQESMQEQQGQMQRQGDQQKQIICIF